MKNKPNILNKLAEVKKMQRKFPFREESRGKNYCWKKKNHHRENNRYLRGDQFNKLAGAFQITLIIKELFLLGQMAGGVQSVFLVEPSRQNGRCRRLGGRCGACGMGSGVLGGVRKYMRLRRSHWPLKPWGSRVSASKAPVAQPQKARPGSPG